MKHLLPLTTFFAHMKSKKLSSSCGFWAIVNEGLVFIDAFSFTSFKGSFDGVLLTEISINGFLSAVVEVPGFLAVKLNASNRRTPGTSYENGFTKKF